MNHFRVTIENPRIEVQLRERIAQLEEEVRQEREGRISRWREEQWLRQQLLEKEEEIRELRKEIESLTEDRNVCMAKAKDALAQKARLKALEQKLNRLESSNDRKRSREHCLEKDNQKLQKLNEEIAKSRKLMKDELREVHRFDGVKGYSTLTNKKVKSGRVEEAIKSLQHISGEGPSELFFGDVIRKLSSTGKFRSKMSHTEGYTLYHKVGFSRASYSVMNNFLRQKGILSPFPSTRVVMQQKRVNASRDQFEVTSETSPTNPSKLVIVVQLKDVKKFLIEKLEALDRQGKLIFDVSTGRKLWLCIHGDKGGSHFKLCATIGNVEVPNSAYHIVPLGMFNDEENSENLACHLGNLITQINDLTELELLIGGNKEKIPVEQFLGGDLKFVYAAIGHMGAASNCPCPLCFVKKREKIGSYQVGAIKLRTEVDYSQDSLTGSNSVYENSSFMFHRVSLPNVIPPSFHIAMGLAQRYGFDPLLDKATELDNKSSTKIDGNKKKAMRTAKGLVTDIRKEQDKLACHLESFQILLEVLERFKNGSIHQSRTLQKPCSAQWCLFRDSAMEKSKSFRSVQLSCSSCSDVFHAACAGMWSLEDWSLFDSVDQDFDCLSCCGRSGTMIVDDANRLYGEMKEKLEQLKEDLEEAQDNYEQLMQAVGGKGAFREALEKCWSRLGADMSAWQQNFCGNHVMKLLKEDAIDEYTSLFPPSPTISHLKNFLKALGKIAQLCVPRSMSDEEMEELNEQIGIMWVHLKQFRSDDIMTPKLHILLEHVLPFVHAHKTWAKTSEQGLEALHAVVNRLSNKFRSTRNEMEKMRLIFNNLLHLGFVNANC
ncbi:unnamed protein product [Caenorhabditis nigoni]